jgi:peroxiredoxin
MIDMKDDPEFGTEDQIAKIGNVVSDFKIPIAQGGEFHLATALQRGPVIINFIKGTWCPHCSLHLSNLRKWQDKIQFSNKGRLVTILIVSNEPISAIRDWLKTNPGLTLFGSDEQGLIANHFGVKLSPENFLKPATFLLDADKTIRMAFGGKRTEEVTKRLTAAIPNS